MIDKLIFSPPNIKSPTVIPAKAGIQVNLLKLSHIFCPKAKATHVLMCGLLLL
jgi:hypothetical protein